MRKSKSTKLERFWHKNRGPSRDFYTATMPLFSLYQVHLLTFLLFQHFAEILYNHALNVGGGKTYFLVVYSMGPSYANTTTLLHYTTYFVARSFVTANVHNVLGAARLNDHSPMTACKGKSSHCVKAWLATFSCCGCRLFTLGLLFQRNLEQCFKMKDEISIKKCGTYVANYFRE